MSKRFITLVLLSLLTGAWSVKAQQGVWSVGVEGGPGMSLIYGSNSVYSQSKPSLSAAAGIFGEYGFASQFSAKLALHYEQVNTLIDNHSAGLPQGGQLKYKLDYLTLPVLVKWNFGGRIRFCVNAGPGVSLLLLETLWYLPESGSKQKVATETAAYHPVNLTVIAGAGIAVPIGKNILVSLEVRDNFGLLNIRSAVSEFERQNYFSAGETKGYTNNTLLMVGVAYRFGGSKGLPCTPNDPGFQYLRK